MNVFLVIETEAVCRAAGLPPFFPNQNILVLSHSTRARDSLVAREEAISPFRANESSKE